jgi:hypothetical protein
MYAIFLLEIQAHVGLGLLHRFPHPISNLEVQRLPLSLTYLAWVVLLGAYTPASIALWDNGACKPSLHDKVRVLKEDMYFIEPYNFD